MLEEDWGELSTKICSRTQFWTKYLEQSKEVKQNCEGTENFDNF